MTLEDQIAKAFESNAVDESGLFGTTYSAEPAVLTKETLEKCIRLLKRDVPKPISVIDRMCYGLRLRTSPFTYMPGA